VVGLLAKQGRFWRYNYQVLTGVGYWILVAPVAASQVVTLWMFALASGFGQGPATRIAELMTPILGAFFVAHSLAPEYRSGVGAVLASKPVSLSRVLAMRVSVGMAAALSLSLVTLSVCSLGLSPVNVLGPLAASVPSLWFHSTLALLFATIFRNPLGGFAVSLGLWGLDCALGFGVHPLLSAQGLTAETDSDPLAHFWLWGKGVQLVLGAALWWVHSRQLGRVCRPPEKRDVLRIVAACGVVLVAYCASGAGTVVGYAYAERGNLPGRDVVWLRRALSAYGPLPVARLFGPAFAAYIREAPVTGDSARSFRSQELRNALARWPRSRWADSIAFALAFELEGTDPPASLRENLLLADRYPDSPFAPRALAVVVRPDNQATDTERLLAARRLLADYPHRREAEDGAEALERYPDRVRPEELLAATQAAARVAPLHRRPEWVLRSAEIEASLGRGPEARRLADEAAREARRLEALGQAGAGPNFELQPHLARLADTAARAEALRARLDGAQGGASR
jgi:hypothetical protein